MSEALIGHSGFVGGNLSRQHRFSHQFNSANINSISGNFDLIVCCGLPAAKWLANEDPAADKANITSLKKALGFVNSRMFVLISTIDVYPVLEMVDEDYDCHALVNHPYGSHRLEFEDFVRTNFENSFVIRLPGLFGEGIRKNVIYDLLNQNCLDMINVRSSFQYYDLSNLWMDISLVISCGIKLINLFTEPLTTEDVIKKFFPGAKVGDRALPEVHYNLSTKHAQIFEKSKKYVQSQKEVMCRLRQFIESYRQK